MKFLPYLIGATILLTLSCSNQKESETTSQTAAAEVSHNLKNGDIIFQTSTSGQSQAIQLATGSKYSHMGIIFKKDGKYFVYEAVQPVSFTPLEKWINRGQNQHYVVKRLKQADTFLTPAALQKMQETGQKFYGNDYDLFFEWSDNKLYCSELVWKIYKAGTGLEIGRLQPLNSFDLNHPAVKQKMRERYGEKVPEDEKVISPVAMFHSDLLRTVKAN